MNEITKEFSLLSPDASILGQIADPVIVVDFEGRVLFWNEGAERLYGRTSEEMVGSASSAAFRIDWAAGEDEKTLMDQIRAKGSAAATVIQQLGDGRRLCVEIRAYLFRNNLQQEIGLIEIMREVNAEPAQQQVKLPLETDEGLRAQATTLLDAANDAIFATGLDGKVSYWNKGAERLYGWTQAEALGNDEKVLLRAEYPVPYADLLDVLLKAGHWEGEVTRYRKTGEPLIVASRWSLLRDAEGRPLSRMVINTDLTETKIAFEEMRRAEREVRARAAELQAILDAMPVATFIAQDAQCSEITGSRFAHELLRLPQVGDRPESVVWNQNRTNPFRLMKDGHELSTAELPMQLAAATGQAVLNTEVTILFEDGTSRDILGNASPLRDEQGAVCGAVGSFIDVTERNRAIASANKNEVVLQTVFDSTTDIIFFKDCDGRYLAINPAGARIAGKTPRDFIGKLDEEVFPADMARANVERDRGVLEAGTLLNFEDEIVVDGQVRYLHALKNVCRDANGRVIGVVGIVRDVTEQKLNEQRLLIGETRYRSLVHATASVVWTAGVDGRQDRNCDEWCAFTGQTKEQVEEFGGRTAIHPDDFERSVRTWKEHVASGTPCEIEHRVRRHDGVYRTMLSRAVPVRDLAGAVVEWVGTLTDVTNQRVAEHTRLESESRYRRLFESGLLGICIPNNAGLFIEANDELLRITGYSRTDLEAGEVRWDTMTPLEYRDMDAAHIAEAAERGSCTPYEKEYIRKDGKRVPILCGYALLEGSQDTYVGFVQDLSKQKSVESALRDREQRFSALAESLPQLIWVSDADGNNVYSNQKCVEYHGLSAEQLSGRSWHAIVHPSDVEETILKWDGCIRTGEPYVVEHRLRRHDGVYRHFIARAVPILNESGQIERWVGVSSDMDDEKQLQDALRRTEKLAAASRLAASIAHEINNPLEAVTNALYLALQDRSLGETTRKYLRLADQELARVAQVTTQTLRFHKQSTSARGVALSTVMDSAIHVLSRKVEALNILVSREYLTQQKLYCYADELQQAFVHIVSNALDASRSDAELRIRIRDSHAWDGSSMRGLRVTIADNGTGIPEDLRKRVFDAFMSTKDPTGTGLGLWVTEGIIKKHNGRIALRSRTDSRYHGTVIMIFLPFLGATD